MTAAHPAPDRVYACLEVPDFPLAALLRNQGGIRKIAAAAYQGKAPNFFLCAVSPAARAAGLAEGMPLAQAKARFASSRPGEEIEWLERDLSQERTTQLELLDLALTASPLVEDTASGLITLDLTGLQDPALSTQRLSLSIEHQGIAANIGVCRNRFVAWCAAHTRQGLTHIFPGQENGFLSVLPTCALPLQEKEQQLFDKWGIRTVRQLAELPEKSLIARFGERGAEIARLARGIPAQAFRPYHPVAPYEAALDLDWELAELESLAFLLAGLLDKLCLALHTHEQAAASLELSLKLSADGRFERIIPLSYPIADPQVLLTLIRLDLESHPPGGAITGIRIAAQPAPQRVVQYTLFEPALPNSEKLSVTMARLTNLLGKDHIGSPVVVDSHRPGAFALTIFAPDRARAGHTAPAHSPRLRPRLSFRHFRPLREAEVIVETEQPVYVRSTEISGEIHQRSGPWRIGGEWWTQAAWSLEEWDVDVKGRLYRLQCDLSTSDWVLAGLYD